jgi:hypothetical protein
LSMFRALSFIGGLSLTTACPPLGRIGTGGQGSL